MIRGSYLPKGHFWQVRRVQPLGPACPGITGSVWASVWVSLWVSPRTVSVWVSAE